MKWTTEFCQESSARARVRAAVSKGYGCMRGIGTAMQASALARLNKASSVCLCVCVCAWPSTKWSGDTLSLRRGLVLGRGLTVPLTGHTHKNSTQSLKSTSVQRLIGALSSIQQHFHQHFLLPVQVGWYIGFYLKLLGCWLRARPRVSRA